MEPPFPLRSLRWALFATAKFALGVVDESVLCCLAKGGRTPITFHRVIGVPFASSEGTNT